MNEIQTHKLIHSPCGNQEEKKTQQIRFDYNTTTREMCFFVLRKI